VHTTAVSRLLGNDDADYYTAIHLLPSSIKELLLLLLLLQK
jgi:hypothetical protein